MKNGYLTKVLYRLEQVGRDAHDAFFNLTSEQISWKPDAQSWSIGECLKHVIETDKLFYPQVEAVLQNTYRRPLLSFVPFLPNLWGDLALKAVRPEVGTPLNAPQIIQQNQSFDPNEIVGEFEKHITYLTNLIRDTDHYNHHKIYFKSPFFKTIIYPLSDMVELMANHHERHLKQAMNVLNNPRFPKIIE